MPERPIVNGEFEASETRDKLPLAAPALVGANVAVKVTLPPEVSAVGKVRPLTEKADPVTVACEIFTVVPPVLVTVSQLLLVPPIWILPKLRLVGFADNDPGVGATPVPESGKLTLPCAPFVAKVTLPLKLPALLGAKVRVAEVLPLACSVIGSAMLLMVNPAPLSVACSMVRSAGPLLEMVTLFVWLDPILTLPKLICAGFRDSIPVGLLLLEFPDRPWQPSNRSEQTVVRRAAKQARRVKGRFKLASEGGDSFRSPRGI